MKPSLLLALAALAGSAVALATPGTDAPPPTSSAAGSLRLASRHGGDDDDDDGEPPSHAHGHDHGDAPALALNASSWYGPDGEVMEPVPGLNAPMPAHHHHGATAPSKMLNETQILAGHKPNPLSYWTHDYSFDADDARLGGGGQHGGWIVFGHGLAMTVAFLFVLPLALAFRTAKSPLYAPTLLLSNVLSAVALLSAWVYRAGTPDLYALDSHGPMGYVVLGLYYALGAWDVGRLVGRAAGAGSGWTDKVRALLKGGRTGGAAHLAEYQSLASAKVERKVGNGDVERGTVVFKLATDDEEDEEEVQLSASPTPVDGARTAGRQPTPIYTGFSAGQQAFFLSDEPSPTSSTSTLHHHHHSERTDTAAAEDDDEVASSHLSRAQAQLETLVWRSLVVLGFACTVSGVTVFAGACRAEYLNGCLAHLIKGGIFFAYGLLTWARYLGAWQEYGWAWNVRPRRRRSAAGGGSNARASRWSVPSAEAVESAVIFLYGATNTWLERLGAKPGAPLTIHEVQHISIAVMFWFCGLLGLLLELPAARRLLATGSLRAAGRALTDVPKPPSWAGSFNPFPALVIGVTGLAMSAHHQPYVLAVEVHTLWGNLLALFGVLRVATYVFLWLRPPRSILPSRPPTEALAAFCLCSGGFVFILSNEQVVYGAMRSGWDSIMAFLTGTISLVSLVFVWTFVVLCAKGWAVERWTGAGAGTAPATRRGRAVRRKGSVESADRDDNGDGEAQDEGRVRLSSVSV